jgi:hypothetical protein
MWALQFHNLVTFHRLTSSWTKFWISNRMIQDHVGKEPLFQELKGSVTMSPTTKVEVANSQVWAPEVMLSIRTSRYKQKKHAKCWSNKVSICLRARARNRVTSWSGTRSNMNHLLWKRFLNIKEGSSPWANQGLSWSNLRMARIRKSNYSKG